MAFLDIFRPRPAAERKEPTVKANLSLPANMDPITNVEQLAVALAQSGTTGGSGETVNTTSAMRVAAVYRCANLISGVCAKGRFQVRDMFSLDVEDRHRVSQLMNRRPNGRQSPYDFRKWMTLRSIFGGDAVAAIVRTNRVPTALIPLTGYVDIEERPDGSLLYRHSTEGYPRSGRPYQEYSERDVFHLRGLSLDGIRSVSVLTYAREAIALSQIIQRHGVNFFRNGTTAAGAFQHPMKLSPEAHARIQESVSDFSGPDSQRSFRPLILEEGMSYTPFGMSSQDAEFVANRQMSILEICIFFGVPPHMIGFTEKQTSYGQGVQEQSRGFVNFGLTDWIGFWEGSTTRCLLEGDLDREAVMDLRHLKEGNEFERMQAHEIRIRSRMNTPNEVRRMEGQPAAPGGDDFVNPPGAAAQPNAREAPNGQD